MTIIFAYFLDLFLGDIDALRYPVHLFEKFINRISNSLKKIKNNYLYGLILILTTCITAFVFSFIFIFILRQINNTLEYIGEIYLIFCAFSVSIPEKGVNEVYDRIYENDLYAAEKKMRYITDNKPANTNESELVKTAICATAANSLHDFFSPIFFAFLGGGILAFICKSSYIACHTAQKDGRINIFFPQALMDFFNFFPSRLLLFFLLIISGYKKVKRVALAIFRDSKKYNHLNDGIPIAAFAGYLNLALGNEDNIGQKGKEPELDDIPRAVDYMYRMSYLTIFIVFIINVIY
ncbi:cobalamin biosynthesis protein [Candidatus Poribacteria bacterium]|nr:cobalamin biosynthesis protein [Candidatus Poribacteria bacterium]